MNDFLAVVALIIGVMALVFFIADRAKKIYRTVSARKSKVANPVPQRKSWRDYKGVIITILIAIGLVVLFVLPK